jgi:branched-chain amino acid transport system ATP-binding protein
MKTILEIRDLVVRLAGIIILDGVNLKINKGEIVGLIGPNGSGKTTLVNTISGLYKPERGEIYFDGERIDNKDPSYIYKKGIVRSFQNPRLIEGLSIIENIMTAREGGESFIDSIFKRWVKKDIENTKNAMSWIKKLNLSKVAFNFPNSISGGQAKLTEIARAMIGNAKLLILDEPAAGVSPSLAEEIFNTLKRLNKEYEITMLIIEHRLEYLFKIVEKVFAMSRGKIIAEGSPEEVINNQEVIKSYFGV